MNWLDRFFPKRDRFAASAFAKLSEAELAQVADELAEREAAFAATLEAAEGAIAQSEALYHGGLSGAPTFEELTKLRADRDAIQGELAGVASARGALAVERARRDTESEVAARAAKRARIHERLDEHAEDLRDLDQRMRAVGACWERCKKSRGAAALEIPPADRDRFAHKLTQGALLLEAKQQLAALTGDDFGARSPLTPAHEIAARSLADEVTGLHALIDELVLRPAEVAASNQEVTSHA